MKCPVCGAAELVHDTRDLLYSYKGEATVLPQVTGSFCPTCGEGVPDATESRRVSSLMREFSKQVNASILSSSARSL
jgi:HTH-type transcriptional regulator/antitoxin MqsA